MLPAHPPSSNASHDETAHRIGDVLDDDLEESIRRVKRLCERIPLSQLSQLENRLVDVVQSERAKRM